MSPVGAECPLCPTGQWADTPCLHRDPWRGRRAQDEGEGGFTDHPPAPQAPPLCPHTPLDPPQVLPADEAVETMLAHMTDPSNASHLPLRPGEPQKPP